MSRNGTLLPVSDEARAFWQDDWINEPYVFRSQWLRNVEDWLKLRYPLASSADLRLTARSIAPFPLAAGHNAP